MVCYVHQGSRPHLVSDCQIISLGHCAVSIGTEMKPLSGNRIFGSRRTLYWHRRSDQVTSRCENFTEVL